MILVVNILNNLSDMEIIQTFLQKGAMWPLEITQAKDSNGNPRYFTDPEGTVRPLLGWYPQSTPDLVKQSIGNLMDIPAGFTLRNETLGTRLLEVLEEPNNQVATFLVKKYITEAVNRFEPRIIIKDITSEITKTELTVHISYSIQNTQIEEEITNTLTV